MTDSDLADRLRDLAADMREVAEAMRASRRRGPEMRKHAGEMAGAADLCEEWADEIAAESIP
jgi:hypothetical protein